MTYSDEVLADSPFSYWRLGEASGDAIDSAGSADISPFSSLTRNVTGLIAAADDDGAVDFIGGWFSQASRPRPIGTAFSIEIWVNADAWGTSDSVAGYTGADRWFWFADGTPQFHWHTNHFSGATLSGPSALLTGQTHHVVGTHDGTIGRLYVDGAEVATLTDGGLNVTGATDTVQIGRIFDGRLDEIATYDSALSPTRVAAHYNAGVGSVTTTGAIAVDIEAPSSAATAMLIFRGSLP